MKSWVVERDERATSRSVIIHGGSSHMPSHSQGAERRPERRAEHTGHRCGSRALVVCAAGVLPEAAGVLPGTDGVLLEAAAQPSETTPKIHRSPSEAEAPAPIVSPD